MGATRSKQVRVSRVADWPGWCSPCESEDRPLVLTRTGPAGAVAWLSGFGDDDRFLLLTCNVCGHWQVVPPREEDDPEVVLVDDDVLEAVADLIGVARAEAPVLEAPPVELDLAPAAPAVVLEVAAAAAAALPAPRAEQDVTDVDVFLEVPPVPAPRERIVTVPDATTLPAFSPEAVAAAHQVLEAARREEQRAADRTTSTRSSVAQRARRPHGTAAARLAAPVPVPRAAAPAAATSIALPAASTAQLVLAAAS